MRKLSMLVLLPLILLAATVTSAQASTVSIGSPLTGTFTKLSFCDPLCINANTTLLEPGAQVASPMDGTVTHWRVIDAVGGPFSLRVLRPDGAGNYTTVGTSAPETPVGLGVETFATSLPIKTGDLVGLESASISAELGFAEPPGSISTVWFGSFPEGADTSTASSSFSSEQEPGFNAEVESTPPPATVLSPPPVSTPPAPAPVVPAPTCTVPKLSGRSLKASEKKIKGADCKLGKVTKKKGINAKSGKVVGQSRKPGSVVSAGTIVEVTLGKG